MPRLVRKRTKKAGLPPGTVIYDGEVRHRDVAITLLDYDEEAFYEKSNVGVEDVIPFRDTATISWINVDGIHDTSIIESIGQHFGIHSLVLEDIASPGQRPKFEDFDEYLFFIVKMISWDEEAGDISSEQVSLVVGENFVISFQEHPGDVLDPVRDRIRKKKGRISRMGPDYLAYSILDSIVDNYYSILEKIGDSVENIEGDLLEKPTLDMLNTIQQAKRDMIYLRKSIWPLREALGGFERSESKLIREQSKIFLRDVYDHTIQVIDTVESLRDVVSGTLDIYMSSVSNRMNEVMKVLTIIATIFIPLTFIAGIYGMNFEFMPELQVRWAYPAVWGVMFLVGLAMLIFFKRKRWL
jgi:magnesium transporter